MHVQEREGVSILCGYGDDRRKSCGHTKKEAVLVASTGVIGRTTSHG